MFTTCLAFSCHACRCQVCFYYDAKITTDSLFEKRQVSTGSLIGSVVIKVDFRRRSSGSWWNLRLKILKERHIFMETRNIKVGGGHRLPFTQRGFASSPREAKERKKE